MYKLVLVPLTLQEFVDYSGILNMMDEAEIAKLGKAGLDWDSVAFVASTFFWCVPNVIDLAQRNNHVSVLPDTNFCCLLKNLKDHYRLVVEKDSKLLGYITRSDLIKFIWEHKLLKGGEKTLKVWWTQYETDYF